MNAHDPIREMLGTSRYVMSSYLQDLSDADLLVRPVPGAHHAAWQLGHLIVSERKMVEAIAPGHGVTLPAGFEEAHPKDAGHANASPGFSKQAYQDLMQRQREKTLQALASFSAEDLSKPGPEAMRAYASRVGSIFSMVAGHELMHSGQIAVIRRVLGKPVVI
jgi:uncharacterized damage-inducible protein DinB